MLSGDIRVNADPNSEFFREVVDSYVELRW